MTAAELIAHFEGFASRAYWDVNHWRVGYGSDTEGPEGFNVVQGTTTTKARALENLAMRIPQFQQVVIKKIGLDGWTKLTEDQRSALTSIAYNYGRLPVDVYLDKPEVTAEQIKGLQWHNGGVNAKRRLAEAQFYLSGTLPGVKPSKPIPPIAAGGAIAGAGFGSGAIANYLQHGPGVGTLILLLIAIFAGVVFIHINRKGAPVATTETPPAGKTATQELREALAQLDLCRARVSAAEQALRDELKDSQELLQQAAAVRNTNGVTGA